MKFYFAYIKNVCKQAFTYRFDYVIKVLGNILALIVQYYIWKALLLKEITMNNMRDGMQYMINYIVLSAVIKSLTESGIISELNEKIRSGNILMDLIKPFDFMMFMFCSKIAKSTYKFFFLSLPLLLFGVFVFGLSSPSLYVVCWGVIVVIDGIIIMFLMEYILGLLSFWFQQTWILERFLNDFIKLFSGAIIPIWLFPKSIQTISQYLPFRYIYYEPITVFTSMVGVNSIVRLLIFQVLWMIILWMISKILWIKAVKKITICGG